jgi:PAS domain S-box-containing protein
MDEADIYKSFFDHAIEGIFLTTPAGKYIMANSRLAAIYGFSSSAELVESFQSIQTQLYVDPGRRDDFVRAMQTQGNVLQFESQVRRKDGSIIWISENARQVRDNAGNVIHYEGTCNRHHGKKRDGGGHGAPAGALPPALLPLSPCHDSSGRGQKRDLLQFGVRAFVWPQP